MRPIVSIIIPCYNQAAFLPKAIASLQAQTFGDWECIIVNDGSADNTAEVAENIALQDNRVRLIQQLNTGSAGARYTGLQEARGKYIQFLDADDTIASEKLERQVARMEKEKLDISYTAFCAEEKGVRTQPRSVRLNRYTLLVRWGLGASVPIHSFIYRTDFIRELSTNLKKMCKVNEDWEWHITCFNRRPKQVAIPHYCGAIYYMNEEGKTGSYIRLQEANFEFMAYMTTQLHGYAKGLWALRISEELWVWLLRMLKYRDTTIARTIAPLLTRTGILAAAILLMPVSIFGVMRYFIQTYIRK